MTTDTGVTSTTELRRLLELQRAAFQRDPHPSASARRAHLSALRRLLRENTNAFADAISADFSYRSSHETKILEIFPSLEEVKHARSRVAKWMRPERKGTPIWYRTGRSQVIKQPLGVIGIIVPWNYPIFLSIGPLVSALAAGNRAMIKMSEYTPRTGELLAKLMADHFPRDHVAVINGGADVAQAFSALPFDHLLFTGSTPVGRQVMRAASENLTPVTLELGGKSPAIVAPDFPPDVAARRILLGKCLNAGQTCIAPDYVMLTQDSVQQFVDAARQEVQSLYPSGAMSPDYSAIVTDRHYARLTGYLSDAREKGAQIVSLAADGTASNRKLAPTLVLNARDDMQIMRDEIFGPLLPIVTYRDLDEALTFVANRPRPLAMYYFDYDGPRTRRVLRDSIAGGVTVNDTILHIAQNELPFGGVGASGMGYYHGEEGFNTFSKRKGVYYQSRINGVGLLKPPFGARFERMIKLLLR